MRVAGRIAAQGSPFPLVQRVSVASDVAETIRSAVGLPGARITYQGQGVFSFAVKSSDVAATQAMLDRVRADLAPVVRRIDAVLEEPPAKMPAMSPVLSALSAEGVSVMETRDGMKHLVMAEPAIEEPLLPGESRPSGLAPSRMGSAPHQESPP